MYFSIVLTVVGWKPTFVEKQHFQLCKKLIGDTSKSDFTTVVIMATVGNKGKLAAMAGESQEYPSNSQWQHSGVPGITEVYTAQGFEDVEVRLLKNCHRNSGGQSLAFSVHWPSWTNFFWTHKYSHSPEPLRDLSGTLT